MNVHKKITRYVVPFLYRGDKEKIVREMEEQRWGEKQPLWQRMDFSQIECDLYDHVKDGIEKNAEQSSCDSYVMNPACRQKALPRLQLSMKKKEIQEEADIDVVNIGFYLFSGEIGFLWYELDINTDSDTLLLQINNELKEFSHHSKNVKILRKREENHSAGIMAGACEIVEKGMALPANTFLVNGKVNRYILKTQLTSDNSWENARYYERNGEVWVCHEVKEEFRFADWLMGYLKSLGAESFFASRKEVRKESGEVRNIPDKAVLFSCVLTEKEAERRQELEYLFHLAKGYTSRYEISDSYMKREEEFFLNPFENVTWFASVEGCAQMVRISKENENRTFFEETYWKRQEIYFFLYVLVLEQYYMLLLMDWKLAKLPQKLEGFEKKEARKNLREYKEQMSLFFMNEVHMNVSHISHQNMLYHYLGEVYELEKMTDRLKEKLEMLNDMVDVWYRNLRARKTLALSVIGSIFVFLQTLSMILGLYEYFPERVFGRTVPMNIGAFAVGVFALVAILGGIAALILGHFEDK